MKTRELLEKAKENGIEITMAGIRHRKKQGWSYEKITTTKNNDSRRKWKHWQDKARELYGIELTVDAIRQRHIKGEPLEEVIKRPMSNKLKDYFTQEDWDIVKDMPYGTLRYRIKKGMTPEEIIEKGYPKRIKRPEKRNNDYFIKKVEELGIDKISKLTYEPISEIKALLKRPSSEDLFILAETLKDALGEYEAEATK